MAEDSRTVPWTAHDVARRYGLAPPVVARLTTYLDVLERWNARINLVGASTLADPWRRHIADSVQLGPFISESISTVADLGSGAGLPGLILSIVLDRPVTLIESNKKKTAFLQAVSRETSAPVTVMAERIEHVNIGPFDAIVARALAPLSELIHISAPLRFPTSRLIFPKGASFEEELTESRKNWILNYDLYPSDTDPNGRIVVVKEVKDHS